MKSCPICRNDKLDTLYEAERVPIMQNLLYPSYEEAKEIKTADIVLTQCRTCGFVFNSTFIPDMIQYDQSYDNEQGHSSFFSHHVDSVIDIITTNFSFDATIVEIGTGKGDFFEKLLLQGFNNIHGFDPAYEGNNPKITKEYFNINHKDIDADLIILRHTL
ncbi:MAG: hypothetical protein C0603_09995 [Denitrovibrio sp.]|nr:MAG: hypothetical protein C0603_09995 [Denitrovibrio sp.]